MPSAILGLALSASVGFCKSEMTLETYDTGSGLANYSWSWYGGASWAWDSSMDHTGNGGGSIYVTHDPSGDTLLVPESLSGGAWWWSKTYDLTTFTNVQCWFKWDTANSTMTPANFNSQGQGGFSVGLYNAADGFVAGGVPVGTSAQIVGDGSWEHFNYQLLSSRPHIDSIMGFQLYDWKPAPWSGTVAFWADDVTVDQGPVFVPPPTVNPLASAASGLYCINSTEGNSFFDRQEVYCVTNTSVDWWNASSGSPVTYAFTIKSMPGPPSAANGCEAWMFLSPNPTGLEGAPDWNEPNMVIAFVQQDAVGNATLHVQYKVNEPSQQLMYSGGNQTVVDTSVNPGITNHYYWTAPVGTLPGGPVTVNIGPNENNITNETGNILSVTNPATAAGTWTVQFTSPTNVTATAPGGDTQSVAITPYYGSQLNPAGVLRIYLGGQANNAAAINQPVVYSRFQLTGTPTTIDSQFDAQLTLDTNTWLNTVATGPKGVLIVPSSTAYWVTWTLPAGGYSLQAGNEITDLTTWTAPSKFGVIPMQGLNGQFVDSTEVPAGPNAFFNLIQRTFSQLQVLLPGETAAPGTLSGKTGTPTPVSLGAGGTIVVTVNAVDSTWHPVTKPSDQIHLVSTDPSPWVYPGDANMANGVVTFTCNFLAQSTGPGFTVTASDNTDNSILSNTSTPVVVGP